MKAIEFLKLIVEKYPDIVAIARDKSKDTYLYYDYIPFLMYDRWDNETNSYEEFKFGSILEWDGEDWRENIITIHDL